MDATTQRKPKIARANCPDCPLYSSKMITGRYVGNFEPTEEKKLPDIDVMFVGEAPGATEYRQGKVFVGRSGELLRRFYSALKIPNVYLTNAALCYASSRDADYKELAAGCCRRRLLREIELLKPRMVVTLGNIPTNVLLGEGPGITRRRGILDTITLPDGTLIPVMPTLHPAAVLRNPTMYQDLVEDIVTAYHRSTGAIEVPDKKPEAEVTSDLDKVFKDVAASRFCILDLETSGYEPSDDRILCCVIGTEARVYVVPGKAVYTEEFAEKLEATEARWVGHNFKFDRNFLWCQLGVRLNFEFDTLLAHYALDERRGTHDLKVLCARYFDAPDWEGDLADYLEKPKTDSYALLPKAVLYKYAAYDGYYTRLLADLMLKRLRKAPEQARLVRELLIPLQNALSDAEARGTLVDQQRMASFGRMVADKVVQLEKKMDRIAAKVLGVEVPSGSVGSAVINPGSPKQVAHLLFDVLGLPQLQGRSTNKQALAALRGKHEFVDTLLVHRRLAKLHRTYVGGLRKFIAEDGRVRTSFKVFGTVTGRLSSSQPNLQNLPSDPDDPYSREIRNFYVASPGMKLIYADYKQAELRMLAVLSKEPFLIKAFREGRDLHDETATMIFGPNFTSRHRFFAKTVNFGLPYGRSAEAIANDANLPGLSKQDALKIARAYFARIPQAVQWIDAVKQEVRSVGYVQNPNGRRRRFPMRDTSNIARVEREAVNFMCQSSASDMTMFSLVEISQRLRGKAFVLLTVHDSILLECKEEDVPEVAREVASIMSTTGARIYGDTITYQVDVEVGDRWGSLKRMEG